MTEIPLYDPPVAGQPAPDGRPAGPAAARVRAGLAAITVADGLMALIGGLAFWLRFGDLARLPLSAAEATVALANWQFASSTPLDLPVSSPAYFAFTHLIMGLGRSGDAAARLVPALFGCLTVLLPWLWRGRARPVAWLVAGLFLALSPLLVIISRTAGGDAIALFALLLVASGQYAVASGRRPAILTGIGLGLGLASSPLFYTGLVGLVLAWMVGRNGLKSGEVGDAGEPNLDNLRYRAVAGAVTFLAVATSWLLFPAGIGAALRLLPIWLGQFVLPASGGALLSPFLALARYEPAALLLGVPAAIWALLNGHRGRRGLAAWLAVVLLLILAQSGTMANAAVALLPAYLLTGLLAAALARSAGADTDASRRTVWLTAGGLAGLGALMLVAGGRFVRLNLLSGENATLISLAVLAFVLAGLAVVLAMAWENTAARRGAFVGLAALLLFWQWGAAWQLSRQGANDPRERWVVAGTDDDVPVLANLLADLAWQTRNSNRDLSVFSLVESPVLRWYLRDLSGFGSGPTLPLNATADVIITPPETELALPNDYFGADFGLEQRDLPTTAAATVSDVMKWWLFRESNAPLDTQRVVVWLRSDLAGNE